jgi:DNA-binding MarR family transcriptional regulator
MGARADTTAAEATFVDDYLAALLARASHLISAEFHRIVQAGGFSVGEWRILATLTDSPGRSVGELARVALNKQPTVTRMLDRMEARGYVERFAHPSDRRVTLVRITPAGQQVVAGLLTLAKAHERRVLEPLGAGHAAELKTMLRRIIELNDAAD